jgi:hypothetical protein
MTIEVTEHMVSNALIAMGWLLGTHDDQLQVREGIGAALALLDPVPNDVMTIVDRDGDEWNRNPNDSMVWCHEGGMYYRSLTTIIPQHGPITWVNRPGEPMGSASA